MAKLVKMYHAAVYNFGVIDNSKKATDIVDYINNMLNGWNEGSDLTNIKRDLRGLADLINVYKPKMGITNTNLMLSNRKIKYIVGNKLDDMFKSVAMTLGTENKEQKLLEKIRHIKDEWSAGTYVITNNGTKKIWFRATEEELDELGAEDLAILTLMRKLKIKREVKGLLPNGDLDIEIESIDTWNNQEDKHDDINFELKLEGDKRIVSIINNRYDKEIIFNKIELLLDYARKNNPQDLAKDPADRFDNAYTSESWIKAGYDIISDGWKDGVVPLFYLKQEIDPAIAGRFLIKELVDIFKNGERIYQIITDESFRILAETSINKKVNYLPINADFFEAVTKLGVISPNFSEVSAIIRSIASEKNTNVVDLYDIESIIGFERGQKVLEWTKSIKNRLDKLQSVKDWTTVLNNRERAMNIANIPEYLWNKTYNKLGPNEGPVILNLVEFFDEVNSKLEME